MSEARWVALHCGDETTALIERHPNAFLLLTQIAMRAKWKACPITKLKAGESLIGDWHEAGLSSEKAYRHAKKVLTECKLAVFRGASKGTVATLADSTIFSVSTDHRGGQKGEQGAGTSGDSHEKSMLEGEQGASKGRAKGRAGTLGKSGVSVVLDSQKGGQNIPKGADKGRARGEQGATNHTDTQNTQNTHTPFALDGASSSPVPSVSWNAFEGFTGISEQDRQSWSEAYPAVSIPQQLAAASEWLKSNPAKRKKNHRRFITGWLSRQQERGGDIPANGKTKTASLEPLPWEKYGQQRTEHRQAKAENEYPEAKPIKLPRL